LSESTRFVKLGLTSFFVDFVKVGFMYKFIFLARKWDLQVFC
jgi:hypothetical protein